MDTQKIIIGVVIIGVLFVGISIGMLFTQKETPSLDTNKPPTITQEEDEEDEISVREQTIIVFNNQTNKYEEATVRIRPVTKNVTVIADQTTDLGKVYIEGRTVKIKETEVIGGEESE